MNDIVQIALIRGRKMVQHMNQVGMIYKVVLLDHTQQVHLKEIIEQIGLRKHLEQNQITDLWNGWNSDKI